jgi:RNA polymerase sigma factor (sigma-70 family)
MDSLRRAVLAGEEASRTDGQLLEDYLCRQDEAAAAALVRRHGPMVWGVCRRLLGHHDAEEAFQATFLVLVRKAASIVPRERVGSWLYGVAHQTALKARATTVKRQVREKQVKDMPEPAARPEPDPWHDLELLLDQELSCLPDRYRLAIVLCDLGGKTRKEAALQLKIPEGTFSTRLRTARTMLAKRLARHGLAVSGGVLAAVLSQKAAEAAVPAPVVSAATRAASLSAAGQAAPTGVIPAQVEALAEGVLKMMLATRLKLAAAVVLMIALVSGGAGLIYQTQAAGQAKRAADTGRQQGTPAAKPAETTARKVVLAYLDNDARGDEEFLGKSMNVSGRVLRVQRVVMDRAPHYLLTLYADPAEDRIEGVILFPDKMPLAFVFPTDARKQLAKLEGGQQVTIEGVCEGRTVEGHNSITFTACRIIRAKK